MFLPVPLLEKAEVLHDIGEREFRDARDDHEVHRSGHRLLVEAERLPEPSLDPVAEHRIPHLFCGDHAESRRAHRGGEVENQFTRFEDRPF